MNSITLQGNILTYDILERISTDQEGHQAPKDYGFDTKSQVFTELENSWGIIKSQYNTFTKRLEKEKEGDSGVRVTRKYWMDPLLSELGYDIQRNNAGQIINDRNYFVSHQDNSLNGFPIHIIGANQLLDKKHSGMRMSAHALIQEYLNHHPNLYALVTNGRYLRLLRDSQVLTKVSYVEFDLQKMISEDQFSDFVLLWKLLHVTRMPEDPERGTESIIEQYHQNSLESGSRIREKLSEAVKHGITILANGLIQEEQNESLRSWLEQATTENKEEKSKAYYEELLRLIYRILFIMVIEERDLIYPCKIDKKGEKYLEPEVHRQKNIYSRFYSLKRLRQLAIKHYYGNDQHYDLWQYMINVFRLYEGSDGKKLGIQALAGDLFSASSISHIRQCELNNDILLQVFKGLTLFENDQGQFITVNYKSLDVEEFGSVYEGLLELDPAIDVNARRFSFVKGEGRSITGSHYTPDELVEPLIKHSLEHLIQDIVKPIYEEEIKSKKPNKDKRESAIAELLKLSVCDVACGSGHILLAAARRIGLEIARLRSGEEQPNPEDSRKGTREAIRHCIYGVDKNPLAVELCKVAMWLEAHVPGEPLNFLDHKIKNGDAIVGLAKYEELESGIPDEAFKKLNGDDSGVIRDLKKQNKDGRKGYEKIKKSGHSIIEKFKIESKAYEAVIAMPENNVTEIEAKKAAYTDLMSGNEYLRLRRLADLKTAQFFIPKTEENKLKLTTNTDYYQIISGQQSFQTQKVAKATATSYQRKFFHWFLEFPEVFAQGGFSTILGNPPFLGNRRLKGAYGPEFLTYIVKIFEPIGAVDLVTYFFRRIFNIIREGGFQSLISTNTIAQGAAREGGLEIIQNNNGAINHAVKSMPWPGLAAVEVALVTIYKGNWCRQYFLNGKITNHISVYLDDQEDLGSPYQLKQNQGKSFQGSIVLGQGFVLTPQEAQDLIDQNPINKEVLFPYLNGQDLNNRVDQSPSRWVINFFDKSEEDAKNYSNCYKIIEEKVKPERTRWKKDNQGNDIIGQYKLRKPLPQRWWQYADKRPALYRTITSLERVLVVARISKTVAFEFQASNQVFADALVIFPFNKFEYFSILQSTINNNWAWNYCTTMKSDLNYTPGQTFETYPFPPNPSAIITNKLDLTGTSYYKFRKKQMLNLQIGLTKTYNQFHNENLLSDSRQEILEFPNTTIKKEISKESWNLYNHLQKTENTISFHEAAEKISELRRLHVEMDLAVLQAYGWHQDTKRWGPAIDLRHGFYEVDYLPENDRVRYTIHPEARKEVLKRLLLLNHEIHESEERGISYKELDKEKKLDLIKDQISKWCPNSAALEEQTLIDLCTAEDLLPALSKGITGSYKPFVTSYCSALENEMSAKLFVPFHEYMYERFNALKDDKELKTYLKEEISINPSNIGSLAKRLMTSNTDKYELGTMRTVLDIIKKESGKTLKKSLLLQDLRKFALLTFSEEIFDVGFLQSINDLVMTLRNPAAHTGKIDSADAELCKKEVRRLMNLFVQSEKYSNHK